MRAETEKLEIARQLALDDVIFDNFDDLEDDELDDESKIKPSTYVGDDGIQRYSINMGDVFAWGCADAEDVTLDELMEAYDYVQARKVQEPLWDSWIFWIEWVSNRRGYAPQMPVLIDLVANAAFREKETKETWANFYRRVKLPWYNYPDLEMRVKYRTIRDLVRENRSLDEISRVINADYDRQNHLLIYRD